MAEMTRYSGSCHCGEVKFEVRASKHLKIRDCSCTICVKKQNRHFIVPSADFKLLSGHTSMTTYTFNTHQAKHMFCTRCGVQSFYIRGDGDGDGIGIVPHCLDSPQPTKITIEKLDGKNSEDSMSKKSSFKDRLKQRPT